MANLENNSPETFVEHRRHNIDEQDGRSEDQDMEGRQGPRIIDLDEEKTDIRSNAISESVGQDSI
jgi:hypothetical protein